MKKNRALYLGVLLLSILFVYLYNGRIVFVTLYAVLLLPVLSCLTAAFSLWRLRITQRVDRDFIIKEEEASYILLIQNRSVSSGAYVKLNFVENSFALGTDDGPVIAELPPNGQKELSLPISCLYRGVYRVGLQSIEMQDFLGLFVMKKTIREHLEVVVYPRVVELGHFYLSMNLLSKAPSRYEVKEEDYTSVSDVRKYEPSDHYKKIHWKLSAKRNDLMVKNFQSTAFHSASVFLDSSPALPSPVRSSLVSPQELAKERLVLEDKIIEGLVAVLHYCLRKNLSVDFIYGDDLRAQAVNIADFQSLYVIAAQLAFDAQKPLPQTLEEYTNDLVNDMNLVIVTANLTEALYSRIISTSNFGHFVSLIYFAQSRHASYGDELLSRLRLTGVSCYRVGPDDLITDVLGM